MKQDPTTLYLMFFLVPLWLLAGVGDWANHRRTAIERTAGPKESALHLLMLAEVGLPMLMALFLEINALVIAVMLLMLPIHEATAWWDVKYASSKREIPPLEQHMHSLLEVLPLTAVSFVVVRHWDQFLALFGMGQEAARMTLRLKAEGLPGWYLTALLLAVLLLAVLPYAEEFWRCVSWQRRQRRTALGMPRGAREAMAPDGAVSTIPAASTASTAATPGRDRG
jgi:hypothetical protein